MQNFKKKVMLINFIMLESVRRIKFVGVLIILFALVANPSFVEKLFSPDKNIESLSNIFMIVLIESVIFLVGLTVYLKPQLLIRVWKDVLKLRNELWLVMATILICFVILEVGLRLFWQDPFAVYSPTGLYIPSLYMPDATKGYKHQPNFHGNFPGKLYKDINVQINSKGLRDYEHNYLSFINRTRILALGDSVTFGVGLKYEDTYLSELEEKLLNEGYNIEIIKAGVSCYEFDQQYAYFFEEGYKYSPDIVMIGVVLNDVLGTDPEKLQKAMSRPNEPNFGVEQFFKNNYKTYKFIYFLFSGQNIKKVREDDNDYYFEQVYKLYDGDAWERYKSKLMSLNSYLKDNNIKLVLIIFPFTQQFKNSKGYGRTPQAKIVEVSKLNNITVIDLLDYLDVDYYPTIYLPYDSAHLNAKGNNIAKEIIYYELLNRKII